MNFIKKLFAKKTIVATEPEAPFEPYAYMGSLGISPAQMKQFEQATAIIKNHRAGA